MFSFRAYFWNNDVYINEKYKYAVGEILTAYLNTNYLSLAQDMQYALSVLKKQLILTEDMEYGWYANYNDHVHSAANIFAEIDGWMKRLPPYHKILPSKKITFEDLLNSHSFFFEDGLDPYNDDDITWDTVTEFGCGEQSESGIWHIRLDKFIPVEPEHINNYDRDMLESLDELNKAISVYFDGYISFLESYIMIQKVFRPFIEQYLHRSGTFPNSNEIAEYFKSFNKENGNAFQKIICKMESFGYKVLKDENSKPILCEEIHFTDLLSFFYYDFWNGLKKNYIPNQCKQCGSFFLIRGGKYFSYCDMPLKNEPDKTCRDVGARRRYDDKCKNDPVWQTYNRAYKAHYARYLKKKMTISQFEEWSRFASDLRDKALTDKMPFEQYYSDIRK